MSTPKPPAPAGAETLRHMSRREVMTLTDASASTLDRWESCGRFPRRIVRTRNNIAWRSDEVKQWLLFGPDAWAEHNSTSEPGKCAA